MSFRLSGFDDMRNDAVDETHLRVDSQRIQNRHGERCYWAVGQCGVILQRRHWLLLLLVLQNDVSSVRKNWFDY